MTDTVVSDAEPVVLDEGIGSVADGNERWYSAGFLAALSTLSGGRGRVVGGLGFTGHDGANDQVDVASGMAYVPVSSVGVQSTLGGDTTPAYDITLPVDVPVGLVMLTDEPNLGMTASSLNDVWLALDTDGTGPSATAGDIYLRHGTGLSAPSHPSVKLGQTNPDDATADRRESDFIPERGWTEDGNSPWFVSGADSYTQTLADRFDEWKIIITDISHNDFTNELSLQINGDTGSNYNWYQNAGTSSDTRWLLEQFTSGNEPGALSFFIQGRWTGVAQMRPRLIGDVQNNAIISGANGTVTSPLTQFTLLNITNTQNWTAKIRAVGRDI